MPFAYWMLLLAVLLPYVTVGLAKSGGFDNRAPRSSLDSLSGWRRRADWAHRNHFEAFPAFAAAVLVAEMTHAPQTRIDLLAGIFVLLRLVYTGLYIADLATLRSIVWGLGMITVVSLFVLGS
ncbi:MAG: MAPEG family protein [Alphaproteobacteria bacterium]|nr:MAPEG family protein [Alphaproteobacteria bacterium]